jgi:hypothetical protein
MRPTPAAAQGGGVQFRGEMTTDEDGRVRGYLQVAGAAAVPFSGWLDLLRLLEGCTDDGGDTAEEGTER